MYSSNVSSNRELHAFAVIAEEAEEEVYDNKRNKAGVALLGTSGCCALGDVYNTNKVSCENEK